MLHGALLSVESSLWRHCKNLETPVKPRKLRRLGGWAPRAMVNRGPRRP
jgi:hypothetical protein